MPANRLMRNHSGFTLLELLIVVAIIGTLASIALSGLYEYKDKARVSRTVAEIRGIEKDIIAYASERGNFPGSLADIGWNDRKDPWGSSYVYAAPGSRNCVGEDLNTDFDLYSIGRDKTTLPSTADSDDDIVRAGNGNFVVIAINYVP